MGDWPMDSGLRLHGHCPTPSTLSLQIRSFLGKKSPLRMESFGWKNVLGLRDGILKVQMGELQNPD